MEAYTSFACVYDTFMDNIPYEEWCEYLTGLMREYGVRDGLVLDLGCGTGNMTELLAKAGYDMNWCGQCGRDAGDRNGETRQIRLCILYLLQDRESSNCMVTVRAVSVSAIQSIILQSRKNFRKYSAWSTIIWIRKVFLFLILIHVTSMKRFLGIAQLQRTGRNAVLSGTTIITKMRRSMNMI